MSQPLPENGCGRSRFVGTVGDLERHLILFDQEQLAPMRLMSGDDVEDLLDDLGRQTAGG